MPLSVQRGHICRCTELSFSKQPERTTDTAYFIRGQNVRFPVFPRNLTFTEGNQQTCLLSRSGKCQNNVNFPILVREIEMKCLFPLVVIQNTTENLRSFRNVVDYWARPS